MIKFTQGWIENDQGVKKDIVVKAATANSFKEMLIGGGIILAGVTYLTCTAFRNGSRAMEQAEDKTMFDLGLIKN